MMQLQNLRLYWDGNNNVNSFAFKIVEVRSEYYLILDVLPDDFLGFYDE